MVLAVSSPELAPVAAVAVRDALLRALRLSSASAAGAPPTTLSEEERARFVHEESLTSAGTPQLAQEAGHSDAEPAVWANGAGPRELAAMLLAERLRQLAADELLVLSLRYEQGLTWAEVCVASARSRAQVRRLHERALRRLEVGLLVEAVWEAEQTWIAQSRGVALDVIGPGERGRKKNARQTDAR